MRTALTFFALLFGLSSQAANFYVTPSGGSQGQTGVDWNHAWTIGGIGWGNVAPGDTVWLAGGTYGSTLQFGKDGQTNNPITVRRVTASDAVPVAAPGYSSLFNVPAIIPPILSFKNHSFVTLDGGVNDGIQITSGGGVGSYTIQMNTFGAGAGSTIYQETIKHLTMYGAQRDGNWDGNSGTGGYGIDISSAPGGSASVGFLISHCTVNGVCEMFTGLDGVKDLTIEYCNLLHCLGNNATGFDHPDIVYIWNFNGFVMRYNWIYDGSADGVFWGGSGGPTSGFKFYGNVCIGGAFGNRGPCLWINPTYGQSGFEVYNNTFVGPWGNLVWGGVGAAIHNAGGTLSFAHTNNIFWNCGNEAAGGDYNLYDVSTGASTEPHKIINPANPFISYIVNATNGNFRLAPGSSPINAGVTLAAAYNTDPDGNIRGANGGWDIGAYELGAPPTSPVTQLSASSLNFGVALTNTSPTLNFSILNSGVGVLTGSVAGLVPPFSFVGGTNYALNAGNSQVFTAKFNPTSSNNYSGTITLLDNGGGGSVALSGQANNLLTSPFSALSGTLSGWQVSGSSIFQGAEVPFGDPAMAKAFYFFSVPATTNYTITGQVLATSSAANSWWLNVDNPPTDPAYVWDVTPPISVTTNALVSLRGTGGETNDQFMPATFLLTAGPHLLTVYGREANAQLTQFTINAPAGGVAPSVTGPSSVTNDTLSGFSMSVVATGTTPISFQWVSNSVVLAGKTNATYSQIPAGISTSTFGCIATNLYGAVTNQATAKITNGTIPTISSDLSPTFKNITNGGIQLSIVANGTAQLFYQWRSNALALFNQTNQTYQITPATAQTNNYTVLVTNAYGSVTSSVCVVSITNGVIAAVITNQPSPVTGLRILGFSVSVGADGTLPLSYQWQKNSNDIAGANSSTFLIAQALATDSGYYRCGVLNAFSGGYVYSANALVTMTNGTIPALSGPANYTAGTNVGVILSAALTAGDRPVNYTWMVGGTNLPGQTDTNLVIASAPAQTNNYSLIAANFQGSTTNTALVQITNNAGGLAPTITTQPTGTTNGVGVQCKQIFITVSGTFPFSYQWRQGGVPVLNQVTPSIYFCPTADFNSGAWDCVVTNNSGSVTSAVASLLFTNAIAPPVAVASYSSMGQPLLYAFSPIQFSSAGSYSPSGLTLSYLWDFGDGVTTTVPNPVHSFGGGSYTVRMRVSDGVNQPVFSTGINLLIMPFSLVGSGNYYRKLMF